MTHWRPQESGRLAYAINAVLLVGAFALLGRDGVYHAMFSRRARIAAFFGACCTLLACRAFAG